MDPAIIMGTSTSVPSLVKSFIDIEHTLRAQPPRLGAVLARIDEGKGHEALYRDQQPQVLRDLHESTRIASITASNAIERIFVDPDRAARITDARATTRYRGRNEQEFAGYRDAIDELTTSAGEEPLSVPLILHVHRTLYRYTGGGGGRLKVDPNEIVEYVDGTRRIIFTPPSPDDTPWMLTELVERYVEATRQRAAHPVLLVGACILDLLAIHPVADGNGRLSRLLTTHLLLGAGYEVSRYASVEQRVHDTKRAYYESLRHSQRDWHEARHDPWPFLEYLVGTLADCYVDFERRVAAASSRTGTKQDQVREYVLEVGPDEFRFRDLRHALPGISEPTIRLVVNELRRSGELTVSGMGPSATWHRTRQPGS
jgi:Fic family protein